jgi:hypothetical protein
MLDYYDGLKTVSITEEKFLEMFNFTYSVSTKNINMVRELGNDLLIDYYNPETGKSYTNVYQNVYGTYLYQCRQ